MSAAHAQEVVKDRSVRKVPIHYPFWFGGSEFWSFSRFTGFGFRTRLCSTEWPYGTLWGQSAAGA